jgi:hypothetical protein
MAPGDEHAQDGTQAKSTYPLGSEEATEPNDPSVADEAGRGAGTVGATDSGVGEATEAAIGPRMVRRVVCSYRLGWLPGEWLQTWRRLDRVFARADLKVKATLAPLEDLPADTDILVVPPDLRDAAREAAAPGTPILVTPAAAAAGAFAELVSRLEAGTDFTAEKVDPSDKDKPKIVSYRGHTLID